MLVLVSAAVPVPAMIPRAKAATIFPMAKAVPRTAHVTANIAGSVTGEESQNAMMGASGTPAARNPVINGSTVTPQTGVTEPIADAITMVEAGRPSNHLAVTAPARLAATHAERTSATAIVVATSTKLPSTKRNVSDVFSGQETATAAVTIVTVAQMIGFCTFGSAIFMNTILLMAIYRACFH
jgi:hypothetical protein